MKRVLIVTYYWPPSGGSGVQRWVKFVKYLPSAGWQPVVYTPENPDLTTIDKTLELEIPSDIEIIKSHIFEPYGVYRKLTGRKEQRNSRQMPRPAPARRRLIRSMARRNPGLNGCLCSSEATSSFLIRG